MRQVVLQEYISLDSLAAGPNDNVDYIPASTQGDDSFGKEPYGSSSLRRTIKDYVSLNKHSR